MNLIGLSVSSSAIWHQPRMMAASVFSGTSSESLLRLMYRIVVSCTILVSKVSTNFTFPDVWPAGVAILIMNAFSSRSGKPRPLLRAALCGMFALSVAPALLFSQAPDKPSATERKTIERNIDLLPLNFEPNQGQSSSDAGFLAQGQGFSALFKKNEADFLFADHTATSGLLRVALLNASRNTEVSGEKRLPGTVNYFIGSDREKWHTGLPTFERLRYASVYPGTDLIYYGNKGKLEFDFQLSPGTAPSRIQMRFKGARNLRIDGKGDLIVTANDGQISFQKPVIYQPGESGRNDIVAGRFKISKKDTVSFAVAEYDRTRPLIIDPILNYSTYIGHSSVASAIAVNQNGEAYIAGWTDVNFPTTAGSYQPGPVPCTSSYSCPFVAKFNSTGTDLLYSTYLGGSGIGTANGIALDVDGDAFVVGSTSSHDFPTTTGALQTKNNASQTTGFVTELNSTGSSLLYSTYLGGSTSTTVNQVVVDASGNAYLTGTTQDINFPTTPGAYRTTTPTKSAAGSTSAFISKLNPAGTALVYSTYLGGNQTDASFALAVDSSGEAYVGGNTNSSDFPVTQGALQVTREASNLEAGFVTKLNASGSALVYSTYLSGNAGESVSAIALDANGNAYATGNTGSSDFPVTAGAFQTNIGHEVFIGITFTQPNAFVSELNGSGTSLVYSTFLGGNIGLCSSGNGDGANGILVDGQGIVYVTGTSCTADFPVTAGAFQTQNLDGENSNASTAFLTELSPTPNTPLLYSTYFGGTGNQDGYDFQNGEDANSIAIDSSGNVYLAGFTLSIDFPTTAGVVETGFTGSGFVQEAIVAEFNGSEMKALPIPTVTLTSSTSSVLFGQPVTFTATVQSASGNNTPTGYIGFNFLALQLSDFDGTAVGFGPWTTVALDGSGAAAFTTSSLQALQTPVNAFYLGDANNAPATGTMTQTVTDIPTAATVTSSANNVPFGTPVVFTATVLDNTGKPAPGSVAFMGSFTYAQPNLDSSGQATWVNGTDGPALPVGQDTVEVRYIPNTGYQVSSATMSETFTALGTTPNPIFSPPAGTYTMGLQIALSDSNSAANIYYTTDGSSPVPGVSPQLTAGATIQVNASETINSVAVAPGYTASKVVAAAYTIDLVPPGFTTGPGATTSMTVTRGSTSGNTGTVSVVGTNGFSGAVNLTCSVTTAMTGVNEMPTCSLNPVSISLSGTAAETSALTVTTTAASSAENRTGIFFWVPPAGTALALALFFGGFRRRAKLAILGLFMLFVTAGLSACGAGGGGGGGNGGSGSANSGTTLGSYTITVTGYSSGISSTVGSIALTVQ